MTLTLEVASHQGSVPGSKLRKVFTAIGGTIGRLPDNDWVLPDGYVSSRHARISYKNDTFLIEDLSTNGVFINSLDNRLERGQLCPLKSGDLILIDPYEIRVTIAGAQAAAAPPARYVPDDPFGPAEPADPSPYAPAPPQPARDPGTVVDPLSLLGLDDRRPPARAPRAADLARESILSEHYQPPSPVRPSASADPGGLIPDDYDPLQTGAGRMEAPARPPRAVAPPPPPVAPPPMPSPRGSQSDETAHLPPAPQRARPEPPARDKFAVDLAGVLAGAGVSDAAVTPELARDFGLILRVVVAGVIDVLQARHRLKEEFRMRVTGFMPAANNPLKFSANVDDALHSLLVRRNPAFLGPVEAFDDAFGDIRNHQMAMLAGVRVAFDRMLKEFDPDRLQQEFDRHARGSLVPAKLRYWDLYRDKFSDIVSDADACFRELFGNEFAKAYEDQLERLKAHDRSRRG